MFSVTPGKSQPFYKKCVCTEGVAVIDPGGSPGGSAGGQARAPKGAGEMAHSLDTGTGTQAFPAPPTLFYQVSAPGPLPEAGSEPGNNSTA